MDKTQLENKENADIFGIINKTGALNSFSGINNHERRAKGFQLKWKIKKAKGQIIPDIYPENLKRTE